MEKIKDLSPKMRILSMENELYFPSSFQDQTAQQIGGLSAGSSELTHGKIKIQGVAERMLFGDAVEIDEGIGIFMGKYVNLTGDEVYGFRVGNPASAQLLWNGVTLSLYGYIPTGGAATDVNNNVTTISGGKITANSITSSQITTGEFITLSAQIKDAIITNAKVVSITADKLSTQVLNAQIASIAFAKITDVAITNAMIESLNASKINAGYLSASRIEAGSLNASVIGAGTINADTISVTNLTATNINKGTLYVGGASKVDQIVISQNTEGNAYLRFGSASGSRIWVDSSAYMGINALGGRIYFYADSEEVAIFQSGSNQSIFKKGIACQGGFNVGEDGDEDNSRFWGQVRIHTSSTSSSEHLHVGGSVLFEGNMKSNHFDPRSSNSYNQGSDGTYWKYIYADDFINKSLGWYDNGVTLQNGKKVTDMEALKAIKPHPTLKNTNGSQKLDPRSMPVEVYRQAHDRDTGAMYPRNAEDRPFIPAVKDEKGKIIQEEQVLTDGESLTHFVSLLFGALKEVNAKMEILEKEVSNLKSSKN